jgi:CHAD domain-containing protein
VAFAVRQRRHLEDELKRIARTELRRGRETLVKDGTGPSAAAVHEARKSVKKVRAVVDVLEETGTSVRRRDRRRLQAAAHALSALRDREALIGAFDRLRRHFPRRLSEHTYGVVRRVLVQGKARADDEARHANVTGRVATRLKRIRRSIKRWSPGSIDANDLASAAGRAYRKSRAGLKRAVSTRQSEETHRWRKRVKQLWYRLRLAQPLAPGYSALVGDLKRLETWLGEDHDLFVLRTTLEGAPQLRSIGGDVARLTAMTVEGQRQLRRKAFALGRRLHARKPKAFARALRKRSKRATDSQKHAA